MVRPTQLVHPSRPPSTPRPAATVLLLRDGSRGVEVLMTRRSMTASFAPGAYVFPGGGIDAADAAAHSHARRRPTQNNLRLTQAIAAIRESFEELGVLLARRADGSFASAHDVAAMDRRTSLLQQCAALGLTLAADEVFVLAHWITDRDLPRRFDVPFLVARMPEGQHPVADETEQFEPLWVRPAEALKRYRDGQFFIIFPTIRTLERLAPYAKVEDVLAACRQEQPWFVSCPRAGFIAGVEQRFMEHEPPFGELALTCPDGQLLHHLDWQHEVCVPLLRNVQRLTCATAGVITEPGTNSYLVGDPDTGYAIIDPGPDDMAHQERLWRAASGNIKYIISTHSHADPSSGARSLQAKCERHGHCPPVLGRASRIGVDFEPDRELYDGERLILAGPAQRHTLRAIHTQGYSANHLCLVLEEDGLLFSGDLILNAGTTVIDPLDTQMSDYVAALEHLIHVCAESTVEFILPAHGYVVGNRFGEPYDAADVFRRLRDLGSVS